MEKIPTERETMKNAFRSPSKKADAGEIGARQTCPDGRTWEVVRSSNGVVRWLPLGRLTRRLYVAQESARTRKPRSASSPPKPNPSLDWILDNPLKFKALTEGRYFKPASTREELMKQARLYRDGWEAITTRNQDWSDERIAESSVSELKKFVKGYTTPGMMEILAQWLAPLLLKALRYRRPKGT